MSWEEVGESGTISVSVMLEGEGQLFVGNLETEVFGGARRGVIYFLLTLSTYFFFLGKRRAIAGGLVSFLPMLTLSSVPPERFVTSLGSNYSSLIYFIL